MKFKLILTALVSFVVFISSSLTGAIAQVDDGTIGYTLNPGDEIHISVWREETLDKQLTVLPDGTITFPLIGGVNVAGVTGAQLEDIIEEKLDSHIPDAEVTVLINNVAGNRVYVIGKVAAPGAFIMSSPMTVAQVLSVAGGLDRFADGNSVKVQRTENGRVTYFEYNYDDLLSGEVDESMGFTLKAGDVVIVP